MSHAGRIENASFNAGIVSFQSHITRFYLLTRPKDEARRGWLVQQSERDGQQSAITVMKILNTNKKPALPCTAIARLPAITNFCRPHYLPARSLRPPDLTCSGIRTLLLVLLFFFGCPFHPDVVDAAARSPPPATRRQWFIYFRGEHSPFCEKVFWKNDLFCHKFLF
jgi:hypothetical protein